jgi:hypothetical protein
MPNDIRLYWMSGDKTTIASKAAIIIVIYCLALYVSADLKWCKTHKAQNKNKQNSYLFHYFPIKMAPAVRATRAIYILLNAISN